MGNKTKLLAIFPVFLLWSFALGQSSGEKIFKQVCATCHTIGQGRKVGPDLANVQNRRSEEWIIKFVRSAQTVINSGDPVAKKLVAESNGIVMPNNNYSPDQIRSILKYIAANSSGAGAASNAAAGEVEKPLTAATENNVRQGKNLFWGIQRFRAGAPSCNSCHNLYDGGVRAGGALGKDLTKAYSRLSATGIRAILSNPPFPAMNRAFANRPLTEDEIFDLLAYLRQVGQQIENFILCQRAVGKSSRTNCQHPDAHANCRRIRRRRGAVPANCLVGAHQAVFGERRRV